MDRTYHRNRNLWIGIGILAVLVFFALPAFGAARFDGYGYGFHPYGFGFGAAPFFFGIGMLFRFILFGGIVFFIVRLFQRRAYHLNDEPTSYELQPMEILRRRYAAGEITREQYDEMRHTLEGTPSA